MTTPHGQLAALNTQTVWHESHKEEDEKVGLPLSKHRRCAEREHLCFTKLLARRTPPPAGPIFGRLHILRVVTTAVTKRSLTHAGNCQVSHNKRRVNKRGEGAEMIHLAVDTNAASTEGKSLKLQPEIVFKVLRIRVKCQKGQV